MSNEKYIGVQDSYRNAANETDVPRYGDDEADYDRFSQVPEPEVVGGKKKTKSAGKPAPKAEAYGEGEQKKSAPATPPRKPADRPQA